MSPEPSYVIGRQLPSGKHGKPRRYDCAHLSLEDPTMKADTHPDYHMIKVVMTDGTEFMTRSTYGSKDETLNLDIDPKTHPAWTGGSQHLLDRGGRLSKFTSRFGSIGARK